MPVTIYADNVSVDKSYGELSITIDVSIDDILTQLHAIHKADYTALESEYLNLVDEHHLLKAAYEVLLEKFDMLDP